MKAWGLLLAASVLSGASDPRVPAPIDRALAACVDAMRPRGREDMVGAAPARWAAYTPELAEALLDSWNLSRRAGGRSPLDDLEGLGWRCVPLVIRHVGHAGTHTEVQRLSGALRAFETIPPRFLLAIDYFRMTRFARELFLSPGFGALPPDRKEDAARALALGVATGCTLALDQQDDEIRGACKHAILTDALESVMILPGVSFAAARVGPTLRQVITVHAAKLPGVKLPSIALDVGTDEAPAAALLLARARVFAGRWSAKQRTLGDDAAAGAESTPAAPSVPDGPVDPDQLCDAVREAVDAVERGLARAPGPELRARLALTLAKGAKVYADRLSGLSSRCPAPPQMLATAWDRALQVYRRGDPMTPASLDLAQALVDLALARVALLTTAVHQDWPGATEVVEQALTLRTPGRVMPLMNLAIEWFRRGPPHAIRLFHRALRHAARDGFECAVALGGSEVRGIPSQIADLVCQFSQSVENTQRPRPDWLRNCAHTLLCAQRMAPDSEGLAQGHGKDPR